MTTPKPPWPTIHAERAALADDLARLTDEQWASPSLCTGWTVRDALLHLTLTAKLTPPQFFLRLAASGFRFHKMGDRNIARERRATPADDLAEFRRVLGRTSSPPGPVVTWLGETIVHCEDIRRPLGITHTYPTDALIKIADFFSGSDLLIGSKSRMAGLALRATDTEWSAGTGPEVTGPLLSLVLAMTGRTAVLADLAGTGLPTLAGRGT